MSNDYITKIDLEQFRIKIMEDINRLFKDSLRLSNEKPVGYKTSDAKKLLNCSTNKLVSLRINRKIRTKKIGGTLYYNKDDIKNLLEEGY
ncbi:MAG: helix-turn-helix domain-containing protein [Agriterribacter sp.]